MVAAPARAPDAEEQNAYRREIGSWHAKQDCGAYQRDRQGTGKKLQRHRHAPKHPRHQPTNLYPTPHTVCR